MSSLASRNNLIGIASLVAGIFVFSLQDTIIKSISGAHAVTLAIFLRSIVSFPILLAMVQYEAGWRSIFTQRAPFLVMRGGILLCAYLCYYISFAALPLAEAIALFFMAPLFVTVMSGPILGERVTAWAWAAVVIGFIGVLIILQPGSGLFEPAALLSLFSGLAYATAMVLGRKHARTEPTAVISFYQNVTYIFSSVIFAVIVNGLLTDTPTHPSLAFLFRPWAWPNVGDLSLMAACGVIAAIAATLLTHAYRMGQANIVTPFEYTGMLWGTVWGLLLFSEVPKTTTVIGMALIATAGVLALQAGRQEPMEA
jgi:drug/metabolite transporter (DMT)-like permease